MGIYVAFILGCTIIGLLDFSPSKKTIEKLMAEGPKFKFEGLETALAMETELFEDKSVTVYN